MHHKSLVVLAGVLLVCGLWACSPTQPPGPAASSATAPAVAPGSFPSAEQIGAPLATVNGMPIGTIEFDQMAVRQMGRSGELTPELRQEVIDRLVEEKLLYMEAVRTGVDKDPKIQKMVVNSLLKSSVYKALKPGDISEEDLWSYFETNKEDFVVPEKVQIKRILVRPDEGQTVASIRETAVLIHQEISERPEDFRTLATKYSKGPFARRGGDMGFVTRAGKPGVADRVVEAAFTLGKGQISQPFETDQGWNIVYVPNRRERVERSFEQMRGSVLRKVKSERYKALYEGFVSGLRETASVDVHAGQLAAHRVISPAASGKPTGPASGVEKDLNKKRRPPPAPPRSAPEDE